MSSIGSRQPIKNYSNTISSLISDPPNLVICVNLKGDGGYAGVRNVNRFRWLPFHIKSQPIEL